MTIILKSETIVTNSGLEITIEKYADKPNFVPFWRYIAGGRILKDMLLSKPNKKRLINNY